MTICERCRGWRGRGGDGTVRSRLDRSLRGAIRSSTSVCGMEQRMESNPCIFFKLRSNLLADFGNQADVTGKVEVVDEYSCKLIRCDKGLV